MPTPHETAYEVIIAGAGPVGLLLACELRLGGCSVLVLERAQEPQSALKRRPLGVRGLSAATQEALDRRDLLGPLQARALGRDAPEAAHWMRQERRPAGHFAGIQVFQDKVDSARWSYRLGLPASPLAVDMESLEAVLTERAQALGVEIRQGCAFEGVEPTQDGVAVRASAGEFGGGWLVGCDGARSQVRRAAGIGFEGSDPEFTGYSAVVELAGPQALAPGRHTTAEGMYMFNPPGVIAMADFDGGAFHRTTPVTREHLEAVLRRISGADVRIAGVELATTWTDRALQASTYASGRVLLAGDAAHIHAPLGGQGLNLGLGDAMNLGWKLAAVVRGEAPAGLLDSYERERGPVGAQVLDWSRAQVALMRPGPGSRALAAVVRDLAGTVDGATYFVERASGAGVRYDLGSAHPLVGHSAPDLRLAGGARLNAHLRDGRGLLLRLGQATEGVGAGCRVPTLHSQVEDPMGLRALLLRPDGIVAWAADVGGNDEGLAEALGRWFG